MNTNKTLFKSISRLVLATSALLFIPLIAMQFTDEVVWTLSDFIFAGALIFGTGLTYILITKRSRHIEYRVAVGFALFTGFFLIWSNLAVGLIGSEKNEFNLLYFLVIAVGIIGGFVAKFKASGLMLTLFAMAVTQTIIAAAALFIGMSEVPESSVYEILAVNGFFIMLFVLAAMLFKYADKKISEM